MRFIMATHGNFAKGIKESIELVLGKFENLEALSCYTETNFNLESEIDKILRKYSNEEIIVITDVAGGSVNNGFLQKVGKCKSLHVISGLNLPLMIEILNEQDSYTSAKELILSSLKEIISEIKYCNLEIETAIEDDEF